MSIFVYLVKHRDYASPEYAYVTCCMRLLTKLRKQKIIMQHENNLLSHFLNKYEMHTSFRLEGNQFVRMVIF